MQNKLVSFAIITASLVFNPAAASLLGTNVLVRNTIEAPFTGGAEVDVANQSATVSSATTEFPSFVDIYDIEIVEDSISFRWVDTDFSQSIAGPIPPSVFDRNYFEFDLPTNMIITDISFDALASGLLSGSAQPSAELLAPNQVLTVFDEGVIRNLGFNPVFNITTAQVQVSEPMSLALMCLGLAGIGVVRFRGA